MQGDTPSSEDGLSNVLGNSMQEPATAAGPSPGTSMLPDNGRASDTTEVIAGPPAQKLRESTLIHVAANVNGHRCVALLDSGSEVSLIDQCWARALGLVIEPQDGAIQLALDVPPVARQGRVHGVTLTCGKRVLTVDLEVGNLPDDEVLHIGVDLLGKLGITFYRVPFTHLGGPITPTDGVIEEEVIDPPLPPTNDPGYEVPEGYCTEHMKAILADNESLPVDSRCKIPGYLFCVDTGDAPPVYQRQPEIELSLRERLQKRIEELAARRRIMPAEPRCPWNSRVWAVPKGQDDIRLVFDGRDINAITLRSRDSHIPSVEGILERVSGKRYFTTLDLSEAYHQFSVLPEHVEKLTFTGPDGRRWSYCQMPFGLRDAGAFLQSFMDDLLRDIACVYLDDVTMADNTVAEHTARVEVALAKITYEAGLKLNIKKCHFFARSARILGWIVDQRGHRIDPDRAAAIAAYPEPRTVKEMQRFLGAINYVHELTPQFAEMVAPLHRIAVGKGKLHWTDDLRQVFQSVKCKLADSVTLRPYKPDQELYLTTDASLLGLGAWLGQADPQTGDRIEPIYCVSKQLSPTQQRWPATKRELYGLVWAVKRLRRYLRGRHFIICVDHRPLLAMLSGRTTLVVENWIDELVEYDFDVLYVEGHANALADLLSRQPDFYPSSSDPADKAIVKCARARLRRKGHAATLHAAADQEALQAAGAIDAAVGLITPLEGERASIVAQAHAFGHNGVEGTLQRIRDYGYSWPRIRDDIKAALRACGPCLQYDVIQRGYSPARTVLADYPWDHIQVDHIVDLPATASGYHHILTVVDVLTGFTVLRALRTKGMEETTRKLWKIFCTFGTPKILQADNAFRNELVDQLTRAYGVEVRLISAYHPAADGQVERKNEEVSRLLKKYCNGNYIDWKAWLPLVQIALNDGVLKRTGSTAFALMFNRPFNNFLDFRNIAPLGSVDAITAALAAHLDSWNAFRSAVLPAIRQRNLERRAEQSAALDSHRRRAPDFKVGDRVYVLDTMADTISKWDAKRHGPYVIMEKHMGGTYSIADATGNVVPTRFTVDRLTPTTKEMPTKDTDEEVYEIEAIRDHRLAPAGATHHSKYEFLVHWRGYPSEDDSWEPEEHFSDPGAIRQYWRSLQSPTKAATSEPTQGSAMTGPTVAQTNLPQTATATRQSTRARISTQRYGCV